MITFENLTEKLTNEELKVTYEDIISWRKTGILKEESIVRIICDQFNKENNTEYPLYDMERVVLSEIAKRHYGF